MNKYDDIIKIALKVIPEIKISNNKNEVPKQFIGYVSNFGANIILLGLIPAIIIYSRTEARTEEEITKIPKAIFTILKTLYKDKYDFKNQNELYKLAIECRKKDIQQLRLLEKRIAEILIALKISLRTFKLV